MLPPGHLATGYLISQIPKLKGKSLTSKEVGLVMLGSIIFDFDFIIPPLFGYPGGAHHYFPIHTPLGGIAIFTAIFLFTRHKVSRKTLFLTALAMLSHLVFDDSSHWFYLMGIEKYVPPQIFWLYPFDPRRSVALEQAKTMFIEKGLTNRDVLDIYIHQVPMLFKLEIVTVVTAMLVFLKQKLLKHPESWIKQNSNRKIND